MLQFILIISDLHIKQNRYAYTATRITNNISAIYGVCGDFYLGRASMS